MCYMLCFGLSILVKQQIYINSLFEKHFNIFRMFRIRLQGKNLTRVCVGGGGPWGRGWVGGGECIKAFYSH